jgi:hypothetical protein
VTLSVSRSTYVRHLGDGDAIPRWRLFDWLNQYQPGKPRKEKPRRIAAAGLCIEVSNRVPA